MPRCEVFDHLAQVVDLGDEGVDGGVCGRLTHVGDRPVDGVGVGSFEYRRKGFGRV